MGTLTSMNNYPFANFNFSLNPSAHDDIFAKPKAGGGRGMGRIRKPELAAHAGSEPLEIPIEPIALEPEKAKPAVLIHNPKWEVEKVGFNEETDISVELDLPKALKDRNKVTFELFAKTPNGPERILQGEAFAEAGKARCRIPIYIPKYKGADGNRLPKVEFYFTAKHSESALLDGSKVTKVIDEMAERLIESHILSDFHFAVNESFLDPKHADSLKGLCAEIKAWRKKHPDGKLAIFGHVDGVVKEDQQKGLSERRSKSVFAFLMKDASVWSELDKAEKWSLVLIQDLLKHLGHDAGASDGQDGPKMQAAVKAFQTKQGLIVDGRAGENTRKALYQAFMEACNDLSLKVKDFDDINGHPTAGCSGFNQVEKTNEACESNRRVAVLLLKSNKNFPIRYPCAKGDSGVCKSQLEKKGERRTASFGCQFYDELVKESPGQVNKGAYKPKVEIIHVGIFFDGTDNNRDRDRPLKQDTNVSKLYDLYHSDKKTQYAFYLEGVGTGNILKSDKISGGFSGRGIKDRILRAEQSLMDVTKKHPGSEIRLSVFGFSRGSATALSFINHIFDHEKYKPGIAPTYGGANNTWASPAAEETKRKLQFEKVWFVGLFDTVASIGMPGDDTECTHDVSVKHSRIRKLTHFVARDERRGLFPCTSIHSGPGVPLPAGWEEKTFPGAHSDVGGGYEAQIEDTAYSSHNQAQDNTQVVVHVKTNKGDYLSRVAGWAMYDAAVKAEVPMYRINNIEASPKAAQNSLNNILLGEKLQETPKYGWTIFKKGSGIEEIPEGLNDALNLLSIPYPLFSLWKSRNTESNLNILMDTHHPDFKDNIYPYIHDSMGLRDPKGMAKTIGINPSPRTILYRGSPK
jgi:outer membrane protein OmpA-like peptidoglycan-associated protein